MRAEPSSCPVGGGFEAAFLVVGYVEGELVGGVGARNPSKMPPRHVGQAGPDANDREPWRVLG